MSTARLPGIQRIRTDQWITSDGQSWTDWHEANAHERFIVLRAEVDTLLRMSLTSADVFARALMSCDRLLILAKHSPQKGAPR